MKISKTRFIRFINSKRMSEIQDVYRDNAVISRDFEESIESIMDEENFQKKQVLVDSIYERYFEDDPTIDLDQLDAITDEQLEVMMPYYNQVEALSERKIKNQFGGHVVYNQDTFKQKFFQREIQGYYFFAFLDAYQEDERHIRIIETKATTSRKFLDIDYKDDDGNKYSIFAYSPEGVLMLREDLGLNVNKHYYDRKKKLFDRKSKEGKYIYDLAYQRAIIEKNIQTKKKVKYYLSILNTEYVFDGKLDMNEHPIYTDDIMVFMDLTSLTEGYVNQMEDDLAQVIYRLNHMDLETIKKEEYLLRKMEVQGVKNELHFDPRLEVEHPIYEYHLNHHGFKDTAGNKYSVDQLVEEGKYRVIDVPKEYLHRKNYQIQYEAVLQNKAYLNQERIERAIKELRYPLYHLDFETFPCPLPRFRGEKPYSQSVFQFSLHIERSPGVCDKDKDHYEFLARDHSDLREEMIKKLVTYIKADGGNVIAYNYGFEKGRMRELSIIFPKYQKELTNIIDRTYDLIHILRGQEDLFKSLGYPKGSEFNYYHPKQKGSYSIKKILPLFTNLSYRDLKIANGTMALVAYARFPIMTKEVFEETYQNLRQYCKQDTWAMVAILEGLRALI